MEIPVRAQLWEVFSSLAVGVVLGAVYDLIRGPRRLIGRFTALWDLLFCGAVWSS